MQEDIAGLQAEGGKHYSTCTRCGRVFLRRAIRTKESSLQEGVYSSYTEICLDCEQLIRQGELTVGDLTDDI
ncbi:MAG: hypothetical protein HY320_10875 [Armatimonadetes bacterium]|nr:hypothetical protein [Armatimonadota bacterium]